MTKMDKNIKSTCIYSTIGKSFHTITATLFPLRSTFITEYFIEIIHLKCMQKMGTRVIKMTIISRKDDALCNN